MRLIDLPKIPAAIHQRLEQRSHERGRQLADSLISSTSQGKGLWVIVLVPAWIMVVAVTAVAVQLFFGGNLLVGLVAGVVAAVVWWQHDFTQQHPFLSSLAAYFALPIFIAFKG